MEKFKNIFFIFFVLLLFLPIVQTNLNLIDLKPIEGFFTLPEKPDSIKYKWFTGEYQKQYDKYFNDHLGFRPFLVRVNNQIELSFFNKANYNRSVVGDDGYLFDQRYITTIYGDDYLGHDSIKNKVIKLKTIQEILEKHKIKVIVVIAPNKARFFYDKIPSFLKDNQNKNGENNYSEYLSCFDTYGINYIDFNKYFIQIKKSCLYPLIPEQGIHWSTYGAFLATDSIINYIESLKEYNIPDYKIKRLEISDSLRNADYDIGKSMNLLFEMEHRQMAYPLFEFSKNIDCKKPSVLSISDSYYFMIYKSDLYRYCFDKESEFWYYFKQVYPSSKNKKINSLNIKKEVLQHDVIILMTTEFNLHQFAFGAIDKLYDIFYEQDLKKQEEITYYKDAMKKDSLFVTNQCKNNYYFWNYKINFKKSY